jgi:hypothetical protein
VDEILPPLVIAEGGSITLYWVQNGLHSAVILSAAKNPEGHDHPSNSDPFQPESQLPLLLLTTQSKEPSFQPKLLKLL